MQRANYGIDAPDVVRRFLLVAAIAAAAGTVVLLAMRAVMPGGVGIALGITCLSMAGYCAATAAVMLWGSKVGKLRLRDRVLDAIQWRGDEAVLDAGCGRGLMLIGAAKRLRTGKAHGIDVWNAEDQTGNSIDTTLENVRQEEVEQRVDVRTGDAREIPFADGTFDVALSSWALHNIYEPAGRQRALLEMIRVLKPGGVITIVDIRHGREYERILRDAGMKEVRRKGPNFLFVIPTYTVSARKPAREARADA